MPRPSPSRARLLRRVLNVVLTLVVLNLVALAGASWYYSSRIGSDALAAVPGAWDRPFTLVAVDPAAGTVMLKPVPGAAGLDWQERDLTGVPFVDGLHWEGGFALTRGTGQRTSAGIVRQATLTQGAWPAVGTAVGAHSFAHPEGITPPWTKVTFSAKVGDLDAAFQPGTGTTWVIAVHGKGAEPNEFSRMAPVMVSLGMPVLAIQYRGDPGQPQAYQDRVTFGAAEWTDLEGAVRYAVGQGAQHIVLMGASMGGAIVASYLEHAADTSKVTAVVLDSPALDLKRIVENGADQIALPGGLSLPGPVTWGAEQISRLRYDVDWDAVDYVDHHGWADRPTLVIHGEKDSTVPIAISKDLAGKDADVHLVTFPGAEHVASWNVDPERYETELRTFLTPFAALPPS